MSESNCPEDGFAPPTPFDCLVLSKILAGREMLAEQDAVSEGYRAIAKQLAGLPPGERRAAFHAFKSGTPDPDAITRSILMAARMGRPEPPAPKKEGARKSVPRRRDGGACRSPASALDLNQSANGVRWIWEGWISRGRISGLAGFEGTGKTRFALDLARRAYHGLPAPDGKALDIPAGAASLWICADGHQDELAGTARDMGIPSEAILFNALPEDPYEGVDLDSEESLHLLEEFLSSSKAPLVFVDTLTNATRRDLCRQSDVKSLLSPILAIAQRQDVAIILLLHLSREGQALGRRVKGLTRTLIHLECPDPDGQPERLRLWVEKTFTIKPPQLGVTMTSQGNEYDTNPPGKVDRSGILSRPPEKLGRAMEFLVEKLGDGGRKGMDLLKEWEAQGEGKGTLFNARDALASAGRLVVDDSRKPQIWHLVREE